MQWNRARWGSATLMAAPVIVFGLVVGTVWAQVGGGGGGGGGIGGSGAGGTAGQAGAGAAQTPGQQPSSPSAPGAADQRQSGASSARTDGAGATQSPGTSPPANTQRRPTGTQTQGDAQTRPNTQLQTRPGQDRSTTRPSTPRFGTDPNQSDRSQPDRNRAADPSSRETTSGQRTAGERTSGQTLREFQFGAQVRATDDGLTVGTVQEDGFFHNAGIHEGDRIISVNGQNLTTEAEFRQHLLAARGRFPVVVMRDGERREIMINADDLQTAANALPHERMDDRAALGIWFYTMPEGAHVVHVVPGSPAERAGLRSGDFLVSLDGKRCDDWQAVVEHIAGAKPQSNVDMQVSRDGQTTDAEAKLAGYWEVFSDNKDWSTVAAEQGYNQRGSNQRGSTDQGYGQQGFAQQGRRKNDSGQNGDWTGRANASGQQSGPRVQQEGMQALERRIRQLEQEVADLREQLKRGNSTSAPGEDRRNRSNDNHRHDDDKGQRTSTPAEDRDTGQRPSAPRDGQ